MTLQSEGPILLDNVAVELGRTLTTTTSLAPAENLGILIGSGLLQRRLPL